MHVYFISPYSCFANVFNLSKLKSLWSIPVTYKFPGFYVRHFLYIVYCSFRQIISRCFAIKENKSVIKYRIPKFTLQATITECFTLLHPKLYLHSYGHFRINLTCSWTVGGKSHASTERTCKFHTERPREALTQAPGASSCLKWFEWSHLNA